MTGKDFKEQINKYNRDELQSQIYAKTQADVEAALGKELDAHRKIVHIENPIPEGKNCTALEIYEKSLPKLRERYGQEFAKKRKANFVKCFP